jgi:hypothetical protein
MPTKLQLLLLLLDVSCSIDSMPSGAAQLLHKAAATASAVAPVRLG